MERGVAKEDCIKSIELQSHSHGSMASVFFFFISRIFSTSNLTGGFTTFSSDVWSSFSAIRAHFMFFAMAELCLIQGAPKDLTPDALKAFKNGRRKVHQMKKQSRL